MSLCTLTCIAALLFANLPEPLQPVTRACYSHGTFYVLSVPGGTSPVEMLCVNPSKDDPKQPRRYPLYLEMEAGETGWYQIWLAHGCLWGNNGSHLASSLRRIPLNELEYYQFDNQPARERFQKAYPRSSKLAEVAPHRWYLGPVAAAKAEDINRFPEPTPPQFHAYAVLPTGPTRCKVFLLFKKKQLQVWDDRGEWDPKEELWADHCGERAEETFPSLFREEFSAWSRQGDYYFLTRSGALYRAPRGVDGQPRRMTVLWQDRQRPIVAALRDADRERTYFFVRSEPGQDVVFFELAAEVKLHRAPRAAIRPVAAASPALRTVLEYAQVLPGRTK